MSRASNRVSAGPWPHATRSHHRRKKNNKTEWLMSKGPPTAASNAPPFIDVGTNQNLMPSPGWAANAGAGRPSPYDEGYLYTDVGTSQNLMPSPEQPKPEPAPASQPKYELESVNSAAGEQARWTAATVAESKHGAIQHYTMDGKGQQIASARHDLLLGMLNRLRQLGALTTEGIFRISGSQSDVDQLLVAVQTEDFSQAALLRCSDVHTMASLLRAWLRSAPLIPPAAFAQFEQLACMVDGDSNKAATPVDSCVSALPAANQALLRALIEFLQDIDVASTKMTADNLGMVFAPTLLCRDAQEMIKHIQNDTKVVSALVRSLHRMEAAEDKIQDGRHAGEEALLIVHAHPVLI